MSESAEDFARAYLSYDEETLESELGLRLKANADAPSLANASVDKFQMDAANLGLADDFSELGSRLWRRLQRELYHVICGADPGDNDDRAKIKEALGIDTDDAIVAAIAGVLASSFGLAPAIAGLVAALVLKRLIKPSGEELCIFWKGKLQG